MNKLQKVQEGLLRIRSKSRGLECVSHPFGINSIAKEALAELKEFMEGEQTKQTLWDAWAEAYPIAERSDINTAKNEIMIFISDYLEQQST